jgi:hypothetical protein
MPNGADTLYQVIAEKQEQAERFERLGRRGEAVSAWLQVRELWRAVLRMHDPTTGCGQEALAAIREINQRMVKL